jgi:hypothetical protein
MPSTIFHRFNGLKNRHKDLIRKMPVLGALSERTALRRCAISCLPMNYRQPRTNNVITATDCAVSSRDRFHEFEILFIDINTIDHCHVTGTLLAD